MLSYVDDFLAHLGSQLAELSPQDLLQAFYNYLDLQGRFQLTDDTRALRMAVSDALTAVMMISTTPADSLNARQKLLALDTLRGALDRNGQVLELNVEV